jgi:hypothetical protein
MPGSWTHPAMSIEQKTTTEIMPHDCIPEIE